jgi:ferredoxin
MSTSNEIVFEAFLNQNDQAAWARVIATLLPSIHEVDRTATRIWFYFFPLALAQALQQAEDTDELAEKLVLQGKYNLKDHIDSSHRFLYGHRYWPEVKKAVIERAAATPASSNLDLAALIREVAGRVAERVKVAESLLIGITAVAMMTLQQVGFDEFKAAPGTVSLSPAALKKSPADVLKTRARDDRQGLFNFLKYPDKVWTVTFDENDESARFMLINTQPMTTAAANDKRPYHLREPRCTPDEGPIPVQCRSASCGTCWVGVLGGAEKLSDVGDLEGRRIKEFGYIDTDEPKPIIRLACQAQGFGAVSIVIPPWNGILGKSLRRLKQVKTKAAQ